MKTPARLIAFGDSFTHGYGLSDCRELTSLPSAQAWPSLLGNELNIPVVNAGRPGASNLEILANILSFEFQKDDIVVVGWTYVSRTMIFKSNWFNGTKFIPEHCEQLSLGKDTEKTLAWFKLSNDYDQQVRTGISIHHGCLYLDTLPVIHHHFTTVWRAFPEMFCHKLPIWITSPAPKLHYDLFPRLDIAPDGAHPGLNSQRALADNLHGIINTCN